MIDNRVTRLERKIERLEKRLSDIEQITIDETLAKIEDET